MSAAFGAWLRRQREARGWSRNELARRMADAAGSAVTAPAHVLESYISRWEAGHVAISARYRQLLDAVLGPGASVPAAHPPCMPTPDPRKWVRAMRAIESDIADGQCKPGDQLVNVSLLLNALRVWQIYRLPGDDSVLPVLPAVAGVLILVAVALRMGQAGSRLPGTARGQGPVAGGSQDDDRFWKAGLI